MCVFFHIYSIYIYTYFFFLIHSLVRGHLDCFQIWPIVNSAMGDMEVQPALWDPDFNLQSFLYSISFSHRESGIDLRCHPTSFYIHKNTEAQRTWITTGSQSNWIRIRFSRSDRTDSRRQCPFLSVEGSRSPRTVAGADLVSWWAPWPHSVCGFFGGTQMGAPASQCTEARLLPSEDTSIPRSSLQPNLPARKLKHVLFILSSCVPS